MALQVIDLRRSLLFFKHSLSVQLLDYAGIDEINALVNEKIQKVKKCDFLSRFLFSSLIFCLGHSAFDLLISGISVE